MVASDANMARLFTAFAAGVAPRRRVRPSVWAERHVINDEVSSPNRPGRFSHGFAPWSRAVHDWHFDHPHKRGVILKGPAQIGKSAIFHNIMLCEMDSRPSPMLYLISRDEDARMMAEKRISRIAARVATLAKSNAAQSEEEADKITSIPFEGGGRIDLSGGKSVGAVMSKPYRVVFLDEIESILRTFPSDYGDAFQFARGRQTQFEEIGTDAIYAWSHPTLPGVGIEALYATLSDQHSWGFTCARDACGCFVAPLWEHVRIDGVSAAALDESARMEAKPHSAKLMCPYCGGLISEAERARAVWPADGDNGGSGRFETQLPDEVAQGRMYAGLAISGLCRPNATISQFAAEYLGASSDAQKQAILNVKIGESRAKSGSAITVDHVTRALMSTGNQVVLPGGELGVRILAFGVDVQAPEHDPMLYIHGTAYSATGHAFVVAIERLKGWAALYDYLAGFKVRVDHHNGKADDLCATVCAVDCGSWTGRVLDACRARVPSRVRPGSHVQMLPVRFQAYMKATCPAQHFSDAKATDPKRPWLGKIEGYELHDDSWIDAYMHRYLEQRISIVCPTPDDFKLHATALIRVPKEDAHGWIEDGETTWQCMKNRRDDWAKAGVYAEVAASLKLGLAEIHRLAFPIGTAQQAERAPSKQSGRGAAPVSRFISRRPWEF